MEKKYSEMVKRKLIEKIEKMDFGYADSMFGDGKTAVPSNVSYALLYELPDDEGKNRGISVRIEIRTY